MGLKKYYKKAKKFVKKTSDDVVEIATEASDDVVKFAKNIWEGKEYRTEECFKTFDKSEIAICSETTGVRINSWEEIDVRIGRGHNWKGDWDVIKNCKSAFAKKGFVYCDELASDVASPTETSFQLDKCFEIFKPAAIELCQKGTSFPITQKTFHLLCDNAEPEHDFCKLSQDVSIEEYTIETCKEAFQNRELFSCIDHDEL
jgi:hypothetical protein